MLYDHNDPAWLVGCARALIDMARVASDNASRRDALLTEASYATTAAERLMKDRPVVIMAGVA